MASYPSDTSSGFSTVSPSAGRELPPWQRLGGASGPAPAEENPAPGAGEATPPPNLAPTPPADDATAFGATSLGIGTAETPASTPASADALPRVPDDSDHPEEDTSLFGPEMLFSCLTSTAFHLVLMILLALWVAPGLRDSFSRALEVTMMDEEQPEFETVRLEESIVPATELILETQSTPLEGDATSAPEEVSTPKFSAVLAEASDSPLKVRVDRAMFAPGRGELLTNLPQGTPGDARAVADDYAQALDRITQELLRLMETRKVLCIWCFDQSESMKDDQQMIRDRIERVYAELGMLGKTKSDALATAVTSFGSQVAIHTPNPTFELEEIRHAMDQIPVDPTGEEMMCRAVATSIETFRRNASTQRRQMALILVSDESGHPEDAAAGLEPTIALANSVPCPVYVLGREAVFGHREARVRWIHPETGKEHWLPIDRGPETAMAEQLKMRGFEPRHDALPSGFGPYTQSRLAAATGGIFFMLPSSETNLVRGADRRYELDLMERYQPDLRNRQAVLAEARQDPLRAVIGRIIHDLDPDRDKSLERMTLPKNFAADRDKFANELQAANAKAETYLQGLKRGIQVIEQTKPHREREQSPRWQANYDLMRAELYAYAAQTHLYRQALAEAVQRMAQTPQTLPGNRRLVKWKIADRTRVEPDQTAAEYLDAAKQYYLDVIRNHPGTPWAARAARELADYFDVNPQLAMSFAQTDDGLGDQDSDGLDETDLAVNETVAWGGGGGGGGGGGWGALGVELVPEYRAPPPEHRDGDGGGGPRPPANPQPKPSPPPKL